MAETVLRGYICGQTRFRLSQVFRGASREVRIFPSAVFLYRHPSGALVLFDTGYPPSMAGAGLKGAIYDRVLPSRVGEEETVDRRLRADGVAPDDVQFVILSHLHPDHIGGVRHFPRATFVLGGAQAEALEKSRLTEVVFPGLLPDWFGSAPKRILDSADLATAQRRGIAGHDLFGDGRLLVVPLPGHSRGHLGALVEDRVLLAGDAAWGREFLEGFDDLRPLPRLIGHDLAGSRETARRLLALESAGVELVFSHDLDTDRVFLP